MKIALVALLLTTSALQSHGAAPGPAMPHAAPSGNIQDVSHQCEPIRLAHELPGLAVIVLRGPVVVAQGVSGARKAGAPALMTLDDKFHLGSNTKAMTATLLAVLVAEGKLTWRTTVGEVFERAVKDMHPAWKTVTVEQLLTNRSGAPNTLDADGLWGRLWQRKGMPPQQRLELVRGVTSRPPVVAAGSAYIYSNAGFAIAGAMAEFLIGRPWEALMREKVFAPLGMAGGGFGAPGRPGVIDQPWGHTVAGKPMQPGPAADNPPAIGPAGTVHLPLRDWARFLAVHVRGDPSNPNHSAQLLDGLSFAKLHTPAVGEGERYAMGWGVSLQGWAKGAAPGSVGRVFSHSGSNTMWYSLARLAPEIDFAVLVACNRGGDAAGKACDELMNAMVRQFARVK